MKEIFDIISNLGFPIGVSCYLLFRFEKKLDALEDSIQAMRTVVDENNDIVKENNRIIDKCPGGKRK